MLFFWSDSIDLQLFSHFGFTELELSHFENDDGMEGDSIFDQDLVDMDAEQKYRIQVLGSEDPHSICTLVQCLDIVHRVD